MKMSNTLNKARVSLKQKELSKKLNLALMKETTLDS